MTWITKREKRITESTNKQKKEKEKKRKWRWWRWFTLKWVSECIWNKWVIFVKWCVIWNRKKASACKTQKRFSGLCLYEIGIQNFRQHDYVAEWWHGRPELQKQCLDEIDGHCSAGPENAWSSTGTYISGSDIEPVSLILITFFSLLWKYQ